MLAGKRQMMLRRGPAIINDGSVLWTTVARSLGCKNFSTTAGDKPTNPTPLPAATPNRFDQWLEAYNEHSGTHEISKLKDLVHNSSLKFDKQQRLVADARKAVDHALSAWEKSQIQHAQLMQTRDKWTPAQALEFAKLLEKEVTVRTNLEQAKKDLAEKEMHLSKLQIDYMNNLRKRYHEEQIWTDKWRILSTYGTWGLIALNSVVFLISQYLFRMRERSRMKDFEMLLKETLVSNTSTMEAIREQRNDIIVEQRNESQNNNSGDDVSRKDNTEASSNKKSTTTIMEKEEGGTELLSTSRGEESIQQHDSIEKEQSSLQDEGDKQHLVSSNLGNESKQEHPSSQSNQPALLSTLESKLAKLDRDERIARTIKQASGALISSWASIQTRATAAIDKVDLPSAALGACVTSVAWLVAISFSRKGGQ